MPPTVRTKDHPRKQYKHSMRKSPYFVSLCFLLAATVLTLLNIYVADLIHVISRAPGPTQFETKYGLYRRCTRSSSVPNFAFLRPSQPLRFEHFEHFPQDPAADLQTLRQPTIGEGEGWVCQSFPSRSECEQFGEKFCVLWSTAGYAAQLSLVPCLASLISLLFIFLHRGQRTARARARRQQWKLVSGTMLIHFILQLLSISLILHVFRTDERFEAKGSHLDQSFTFGVASALVSGLMVILLTFTGLAARAGKPWAAGRSARKARRHRRTRSGQVVRVPEGVPIPPDQAVTVGEVEAAGIGVDERTALLSGSEQVAEGGAGATDV
ncbi:hypothetical protein EHS25_006950 [Saitozyma podzolica]|uniref:Uncharacterized protein n=1 Tax=Saitozyma podzolica TaxID=1890683 RepID=A0A427XRJ4_9TREE|nr:hypothetical protein EHS25_006950 [Saitozyma podzolica]